MCKTRRFAAEVEGSAGPVAASDGDLRIVHETGEDYLYPAEWFIPIEIPEQVRQSVLQASD